MGATLVFIEVGECPVQIKPSLAAPAVRGTNQARTVTCNDGIHLVGHGVDTVSCVLDQPFSVLPDVAFVALRFLLSRPSQLHMLPFDHLCFASLLAFPLYDVRVSDAQLNGLSIAPFRILSVRVRFSATSLIRPMFCLSSLQLQASVAHRVEFVQRASERRVQPLTGTQARLAPRAPVIPAYNVLSSAQYPKLLYGMRSVCIKRKQRKFAILELTDYPKMRRRAKAEASPTSDRYISFPPENIY